MEVFLTIHQSIDTLHYGDTGDNQDIVSQHIFYPTSYQTC